MVFFWANYWWDGTRNWKNIDRAGFTSSVGASSVTTTQELHDKARSDGFSGHQVHSEAL